MVLGAMFFLVEKPLDSHTHKGIPTLKKNKNNLRHLGYQVQVIYFTHKIQPAPIHQTIT